MNAKTPPAAPIEFPRPTIGEASCVTATVYNPAHAMEADVPNVVYEILPNGDPPTRAYWIGRKLKDAIYGCVRSCTVLKLREGSHWTGPQSGAAGGGAIWEVTPDMAAVKITEWNRVWQLSHIEDPVKDVAAMQYINRDGGIPNVLGTLDALSDKTYLYHFLPFCSNGDLFGVVDRDGRFTEPVARFWFRQLLNGLFHLQEAGISHRDLSLENVLLDEMNGLRIIDLGMCLRVPFEADNGAVCDVSQGRLRRLMPPQGQCGKLNYMSPEVFQNTEPFDGFKIDVWACGVILFIMLAGCPPYALPNRDDPRFRMIKRGRLMHLLALWKRPISDEAGDLIQKMLNCDPNERLSLMGVMNHPWVVNGKASPPPQSHQPPDDGNWEPCRSPLVPLRSKHGKTIKCKAA